MDRSFLSNKQLIKISREFVCIRTATYEDKREAGFLKWAFLRSPTEELRNFGYCILSPDGKRKLRRSVRGPNYLYPNSGAMVADLQRIARQFSPKTTTSSPRPAVPRMKTVRLGINVASCDGLPGVVVFGKDRREVDELNSKLSGVIWEESLAGKFIYASTTKPDDLKIVDGAGAKTGILVVEPDVYGMKGRLLRRIDVSVSERDLKKNLIDAADRFTRRPKSHGLHVRNGRRDGRSWKTEVPVPTRVRSKRRTAPGRRRE
ncbi:MAG: hypothetical protein CMJ68_07710 [Planctomycetaceae bacterium]|nr:hypothetical protein [Planctomycetaceae bacterium]|tara:strand:+ start:490 stop:1272 length:783 start_codon:yes stop_codon:yes gene_type:complete